jgi:hypothetical protein
VPASAATLSPVRIEISEQSLDIRLSWWQKALGLLRDISVPRTDISDVRIVAEPLADAMSTGLKIGLRLPWLYYVARTIRLDNVFIVRRGVPALSFAVHNQGPLQRVLVSVSDAEELAQRLGGG